MKTSTCKDILVAMPKGNTLTFTNESLDLDDLSVIVNKQDNGKFEIEGVKDLDLHWAVWIVDWICPNVLAF